MQRKEVIVPSRKRSGSQLFVVHPHFNLSRSTMTMTFLRVNVAGSVNTSRLIGGDIVASNELSVIRPSHCAPTFESRIFLKLVSSSRVSSPCAPSLLSRTECSSLSISRPQRLLRFNSRFESDSQLQRLSDQRLHRWRSASSRK